LLFERLQEVSDETNDTGEGTASESSAGSGTLELWWSWDGGDVGWWSWSNWATGWDNDGAVWVGDCWGVGWGTWARTSTARGGDGGVGLGAGAWAVGDGQGGWLGDGVGDIVLDNGGWERAVGGVGRDGLGDGDLSSVSSSDNGTNEGGSGDDCELHFDFWEFVG